MPYKKTIEPFKILLKKDDTVQVITGKDKGKSGRVLEVDRSRGRVLVEGINLVKKHLRANPAKQIKGGIAERESSIHVSNVMIVGSDGKPTRIGIKEQRIGGKMRRTRVSRKTGETLEKKG